MLSYGKSFVRIVCVSCFFLTLIGTLLIIATFILHKRKRQYTPSMLLILLLSISDCIYPSVVVGFVMIHRLKIFVYFNYLLMNSRLTIC